MNGTSAVLRMTFLLMFSLAAFPARAEMSDVTAAVHALAKVRDFEQVAISPDGAQVAWVELLRDASGAPSRNTAIYCKSRNDTAQPKRITVASGKDAREHDVAWSPDSRQIVFVSDAEKAGAPQLYLGNCSGSKPKRVTSLTGYLDDPRWSPDGKKIAVLFTEGASGGSDPLEASPPRVGEFDEQIAEQRIAVVTLATSETKVVSPPDMYVYEYDWAPDGSAFALTSAPGSGENNWWIAQLYTLPSAGGKMTSIYKPPLQIAIPRCSPDGKSIAFIAGLMSDEASTGGDVFIINASGGEPRNVTPKLRGSASWLAWTSPAQILFVQDSRGKSAVTRVDVGTDKIEELWSGNEFLNANMWMGSLSVAHDGVTTAAVSSSFTHPPEVFAGPIGAWKPLTSVNSSVRPLLGKTESVSWKSDAYDVQGWLVFPLDYDPAKKYPLVVDVHGGPASVLTSAWPKHFYEPILLSGQGYFVFFPNPRGSYGQGEEFTQANVKDFGYGDLNDILRGVDTVISEYPIDPGRLGITGWSYGGFMTMWAVTQTNRFAAAVAGAGIMNWQSYYGENEIDQWMIPYFGASVYDDPAVYARSSPISFIKNVKTPTLVVVGQYDAECPSPQSFEFWHALKTLHVPTSMVVYAGEGHQFHAPENRLDVNLRMIDWFNKRLPRGNEKAK
ncbi:MAG: S9 family peptidase [Acidobacteria bacterium]|nr:MAG: S9 family peptidase [Acidobacteriota bacterium]